MKTVYSILIAFIAFESFIHIDGHLFYIEKEPAIPTILEDETCDCSKVLPLNDMSKVDTKTIKLRDEIKDKFENVDEPKIVDDDMSEDSDENTSSQPVDSMKREKRESKLTVTRTNTPTFMWGNMMTIQSMGPIKNLLNSNGDTGFEIKELQIQEINAEKIRTPFNAVLNRPKRAASTNKFPKRIRISVKDVKLPKATKTKIIKKRSIFDEPISECQTIQNLRQRKDLNRDIILQYLPEVGSACTTCGSQYINQHEIGCNCGGCMQCGCTPPMVGVIQHRPHYIEYSNDGTPVTYIPGRGVSHNPIVTSPRYVFDQFGHRYVENNGNLKIIMPDHIVGAASPTPHQDHTDNVYVNKIREILNGYKDFQDWNSGNEIGELAPPVLDQGFSMLEFLQKIVKNRYNEPRQPMPVTVENAFNDKRDLALQTNSLSFDEGDAKVKDNEINI